MNIQPGDRVFIERPEENVIGWVSSMDLFVGWQTVLHVQRDDFRIEGKGQVWSFYKEWITKREPKVTPLHEQEGKRLRYIRKSLGLSTQEFANKFEVSKTAVNNWEQGTTEITPKAVKKLKEAGVDINYLLLGEEETKVEEQRCGNCRFWRKSDKMGFCQKMPPVPNFEMESAGIGFSGVWPMTGPEKDCGEWRGR